MIWRLQRVDAALIAAFESAGEPDQAVINAYLASSKSRRPQRPQSNQGVKRWYYLLTDNPRVRLLTIGMPLDIWQGGAKIIVGTAEIIGEFAGNRDYIGMKGLPVARHCSMRYQSKS